MQEPVPSSHQPQVPLPHVNLLCLHQAGCEHVTVGETVISRERWSPGSASGPTHSEELPVTTMTPGSWKKKKNCNVILGGAENSWLHTTHTPSTAPEVCLQWSRGNKTKIRLNCWDVLCRSLMRPVILCALIQRRHIIKRPRSPLKMSNITVHQTQLALSNESLSLNLFPSLFFSHFQNSVGGLTLSYSVW